MKIQLRMTVKQVKNKPSLQYVRWIEIDSLDKQKMTDEQIQEVIDKERASFLSDYVTVNHFVEE